MNFSLHQLNVFVAVADTSSFSRAAEELLLSQPAVSMQIKGLERALGLRLFDHVGKHIYLTEAGKDFYLRASRILGLAREAADSMADLREGRRGRLRVVATTTVGIYVVPNLLGAYHKRHPEVEIRLEIANWEQTCERLFRGEADVGIAGPHPQPGLRMEPFMDDELVVIAAPSHPLADRRQVTLEELATEPMLVRESGSGTRAAVENLFAERELPLHRAMELSRNGAIKQVTKAGLGVAVISRGAISLELAAGTLCVLEVESFPIVRSWNIITRAGFSLPPAAAAFRDEIRSDRGE
jgi:DNA-binding transcriptional LysR family regulator